MSRTQKSFGGEHELTLGHVNLTRSWKMIETKRGEIVLTSLTEKDYWWKSKPGTENVATCTLRNTQGTCEDDDHECGFWGYHTNEKWSGGHIEGIIQGYGRTTVGTKGARCEKARIVALAKPQLANNKPNVFTFLLFVAAFGIMFILGSPNATDNFNLPNVLIVSGFVLAFGLESVVRHGRYHKTMKIFQLFEKFVEQNPSIDVYDTFRDAQLAHPIHKP